MAPDPRAGERRSAEPPPRGNQAVWRITKMAFEYRWEMALGILTTIIAAIFQILVPQFLGNAVDAALDNLSLNAEGDYQPTSDTIDMLLTLTFTNNPDLPVVVPCGALGAGAAPDAPQCHYAAAHAQP